MNIFVLDTDPKKAAEYHCDKHVVKMVLETTQILCTVRHLYGLNSFYKPTHQKHPCVLWAAASKSNYLWTLKLGFNLSDQFEMRYNKQHKSELVLQILRDKISEIPFKQFELTEFTQAMPEKYQMKGNPVDAYRNYYIFEKNHFAEWKLGNIPSWFSKSLAVNI